MNQSIRNPIRNLDVEALRVPVERETATALNRDPEFRRILASMPPVDERRDLRELKSMSLRLSEAMAPEIYKSAREASELLRIDKPVEIYQARGEDNVVFFSGTKHEKLLLMLRGSYVSELDHAGRLLILGHELGHYLAHQINTPAGRIGAAAHKIALFGTGTYLDNIGAAHSMARELTADRFGMLACQDVEAMLRVHMVEASGVKASSMKWDPLEYLKEARALMDETLTKGEVALGLTHPEHNLRTYAAWLFSETELYRELTGRGGASRTIAQINTVLRKLIRPQIPSEPPQPRPQPSGRPRPVAGGGPGVRRPVARSRAGLGGFGGRGGEPVVKDDPKATENDDVDRVVGGVQGAVRNASQKLRPGFSKVAKATTDGVSRVLGRRVPSSAVEETEPEDFPDPLADDEDDLLDKFAALEKKMKEQD